MKTIKQIADEIGVSKTAIRKKMPPEVKTKFTETRNNVIYILPEGESLIKSAFSGRVVETKFPGVSENQFPGVSGEVSTLITILQNELDAKNRQLDAKDKQIGELTAALEHTSASLQAAQALHAGTMRQQLLPESSADTDSGATEEPPAKRRGFFGWLERIK